MSSPGSAPFLTPMTTQRVHIRRIVITSQGADQIAPIDQLPFSPTREDTVTIGTQQKLRRLLPRQFADWRGWYMIEGDPAQRWRECRVRDITSAGAGLELRDSTSEETRGRRIILAIQLTAEVRYAHENSEEGVRAGAQFVDLSEAERAYIASLVESGDRW